MSMRSVYRKIARQNGMTLKELKLEMQEAVDMAWNDPQNNGIIRAYQERIPRRGTVPTADEVIRYSVCKIKG